MGLDHRPRGLDPIERLAAAFVETEIRNGRLRTDQEIQMVRCYGDALELYHRELEASEGGQNGTMVEVRDHMLPVDLLTEYVDGQPRAVPLRVVSVTFPPSLTP